MANQPNVIMVLTDDQGYPPIGAHGHPFIQTPALDDFHADCARMEQFHSGTTCAPTRAGLLTGHNCNSTGVWHTVGGRSLLQRDEWSLADALKESGYATGMFGKWHMGDSYPYRPQDRGFDTVICHGGGGISQQHDWWGNDYFDDTYMVNGEPREFEGYCTDVWFDEAISFIDEHQDDPFFCYLSTNAPHGPFNVPTEYRDLYEDDAESELYARFLGMITNIDDNFARLRQHLRKLDLEEDTILIFMSDNGQTGGSDPEDEAYNAGMRGLKGSPYEGGHRVPFFIRWPGGNIGSGYDVTEVTSYIDVMPTILNLCGIDVPDDHSFHGNDLTPLLRGDDDPFWHERILVTDTQRQAYPIKWRLSCVMKNRWRLVNRTELYDLESDPSQQNDVSAEHPDLIQEMREAYDHWWETCINHMEKETPISVGAHQQDAARLFTFDMRNEGGHLVVWNQGQVRDGQTCHGWWEIDVEREGLYEFELRRWPREAGHNIQDGIEGTDIEYNREGVAPGAEGLYSGGKALDVDTACLDISGESPRYKEITAEDASIVFRVELEEGRRQVRAHFTSADGDYMATYYVYVRPVDEPGQTTEDGE